VAEDPWGEISRVAKLYRCESLVVGLGELTRETMSKRLGRLVNSVQSNVVILRAPQGWEPGSAENVLVPVGGRRDQSVLRARLIANLSRARRRRVTYHRVLAEGASQREHDEARKGLVRMAQDEASGHAEVVLSRAADASLALVRACQGADLVVLGLQRLANRRRVFGDLTLRLATETSTPLILISQR
jgi:nucleotide-binding universal stress UspA family protein